jgi:hypothetical protein
LDGLNEIHKKQMTKETFTKAEVVSFGNYLLSDERKGYVLNHPEKSNEQKNEALKQVSDADIFNWDSAEESTKEE